MCSHFGSTSELPLPEEDSGLVLELPGAHSGNLPLAEDYELDIINHAPGPSSNNLPLPPDDSCNSSSEADSLPCPEPTPKNNKTRHGSRGGPDLTYMRARWSLSASSSTDVVPRLIPDSILRDDFLELFSPPRLAPY